jgi:hypothetical protein
MPETAPIEMVAARVIAITAVVEPVGISGAWAGATVTAIAVIAGWLPRHGQWMAVAIATARAVSITRFGAYPE